MEIYELFAEKMVLQTVLEVVYGHESQNEIVKNRSKRKHPLIMEPTPSIDWLTLPEEIWLNIFSYLTQAELYFIVHAVCKSFHFWSRDISLWRSIDFHEMHLNMKQLSDTGLILDPPKISCLVFCNLITVFRNYVTSVAMSRFGNDCGLNGISLKNLCMCTSITKLDIGFCYEADMLSKISLHFPKLEDLNAEGCSELKDQDFTDIHLLTNLRKICVSHCAFLTDEFLSCLYDLPNLRELLCDGVMHFTEFGLIQFLKQQPQLEVLILDGEDMTDDLVCFAASNLENLMVFEMSFSQCLTDKSIDSFKGKHLMKKLKFRKCSEITASSVCNLFDGGSLDALKSLSITESEGITDETLDSLSQWCPLLESLIVDWCWQVTDNGLCLVVARSKNLIHLSMVGLYGLTGTGWLDRLDERLPRLKFLDASDCNTIPDDDLIDLVRRKPSLEVYTYYHTRVQVEAENSEDSNGDYTSEEENQSVPWTCPGERGVEVLF